MSNSKLKQLEGVTQRLRMLAQAEEAVGNTAGAQLIAAKAAELEAGKLKSVTGAFFYANGQLIEFDRPEQIEPRTLGKILEWLLPSEYVPLVRMILGI